MTQSAKIAISLPRSIFQTLERERKRLQRSRSALIAEALEQWFREAAPSDDDRRYVEAYLRHPERLEEAGAVAAAVMQTWGPWDAEG